MRSRVRALALVCAGIVLTALLSPTPNSSGAVRPAGDSAQKRTCAPAPAPAPVPAPVARGQRKHRRPCPGEVLFRRHKKVKVRKKTGGFPAPDEEETEGEEGERPPLPVGTFRAPPSAGAEGALTVEGADGSTPPFPLKIHVNRILPAATFPAGVYLPTNTLSAQEPSVAYGDGVVMYTFNWDAGYSTDGGRTFTELDPHTTFPSDVAPYFVHFGTDQIVTYDPTTKTFIWVLQEFSSGSEDVIRIAWARASTLASLGAHAWRYFDLPSDACCGVGAGHFLDQPRLGFTPRYLYMNVNEGTGNTVKHTVILRIPRAQFGTAQGPSGYGFALVEPASLRVAQNVVGSTAFFVGHKNTSTLTVASIDDNSNAIRFQDIDEPTVANQDWTIMTPGGQDLLGRQRVSQNTAVTGVTQDGAGKLWVAWSEGRAIVDSKGSTVIPSGGPTQPHIALVVLNLTSGNTVTGGTKGFLWNANHAFFLPDLATGASGEVAMTYDWGGGTAYLNHAVAFLSGGFVSVTVAGSNTDQTTTGVAGDNNLNNPAGDYQTIRPLPAPYGDCFVAAGNINHNDELVLAPASAASTEALPPIFGLPTHVGLPVFTLFSRPGATCPLRFFPPPRVPLPPILEPVIVPEATSESIALTCPSSVVAGQSYAISGTLSPAIAAAPITITYTSSDTGTPAITHTVSTASSGAFTDTAPGAPAGTETIRARYGGDGTHTAAEVTCSVTIQPIFL